MAVSITGEAVISTLGVVYVYTLTGVDTNKPIEWSGDNCFDLRVGEYEKVWRDTSDHSKGYDFLPKVPTDTMRQKASIIVDEDLHHQTNHFRVYVSCFDNVTKEPTQAMFEGQVAMTVPEAVPARIFRAVEPTEHTIPASDKTPSIAVKFKTTYDNFADDVTQHIVFSGDSGRFFDLVDDVTGAALTPSNGIISKNLSLAEYRPNGRFNGHTTVSVWGVVRNKDLSKGTAPLAADGYKLYLEYGEGDAVTVRILKTGENKFLRV